uniref:SAP domain-containing protein n=1 Tax=Otolemur garnettii TaxID=30611 RepID=H0Y0Z4_OTOGA
MENTKGKEWNSTDMAREEEAQQAASHPSAPAVPGTSAKGTKRKTSVKGNNEFCPPKKEHSDIPKLQKKVPDELPPVNLLSWDTVWAWCQQLGLSTGGQKLDVDKRLCTCAFPNQKDIPSTAKEAKIQKKSNVDKKEMSLEGSEGTDPPAVVLAPGLGCPPSPDESASLHEGVNIVVTTSAPEALLAS